MIDINRNNYEEYFLDFLEGNLSASEKELLMSFLNDNPDLKEELELLDEIPELQTEESFPGKIGLRKSATNNSSDNFDELCIARIEGDLSKSENAEFDSFIQENEKRKRDFEIYKLTKIKSDTNIVFQNKNSLKKSNVAVFFTRNRYTIMSAAASVIVAVAIFTFISKTNLEEPIKQQVAEVTDQNIIKEKQSVIKIAETKSEENINQNRKEEKITLLTVKNEDIVTDTSYPLKAVPKHNYYTKLSVKEINLDYKPVTKRIVSVELLTYEYEQIDSETNRNHTSIKTLIAGVLNKQIFKQDRNDKIELFDVAKASLNGINRITGSNMSLTRVYDENGKPDKTEFNSKLIAFSTPAKKD